MTKGMKGTVKGCPPKGNKPNTNMKANATTNAKDHHSSATGDNVSSQLTNQSNHLDTTDINCKSTNLNDIHAYYEEKFKMLEEMFKMSEVSFNSKVDGLYKILEQKDEVIGKLNIQIGELKKSFDFLSKETSDIKVSHENTTKTLENEIKSNGNFAHEIKTKTIDLEDRSRRDNLVFFNFPEAPEETAENCEHYIKDLISSLSILPEDEELYIDRAHRLGRKTPECASKPDL